MRLALQNCDSAATYFHQRGHQIPNFVHITTYLQKQRSLKKFYVFFSQKTQRRVFFFNIWIRGRTILFFNFRPPPTLHDLPAPSGTSRRPRCTDGSCGRGLSSERGLDSQSQRWPVTLLSQHTAVFTSTHTHAQKPGLSAHLFSHIQTHTSSRNAAAAAAATASSALLTGQ